MTNDYIPTARAAMATGRIKKSIDELGEFDWDVIARIINETLDDAEMARLKTQEGGKP